MENKELDIKRHSNGTIDWSNENNVELFKKYYLDLNYTTREVAKMFGFKHHTGLSRQACRFKLNRMKTIRFNMNDDVKKFIESSVDNGMDQKTIAEALGISKYMLYKHCRNHGVKLKREFNRETHHICTECQKILPKTEFYRKGGKSSTQVSSKCKKCILEKGREKRLKEKFKDVIK